MIGLLLFLPAGTFNYWNAWILMGLLFIPMFILGFIIAGLDFRYGWSNISIIVIAIASVIFVLGSWISFVIFCFFPFVLVKRIKNEEAVLENGLKGYKEYKQKVKYKIIPFVW